jgi:hypothetical protein
VLERIELLVEAGQVPAMAIGQDGQRCTEQGSRVTLSSQGQADDSGSRDSDAQAERVVVRGTPSRRVDIASGDVAELREGVDVCEDGPDGQLSL